MKRIYTLSLLIVLAVLLFPLQWVSLSAPKSPTGLPLAPSVFSKSLGQRLAQTVWAAVLSLTSVADDETRAEQGALTVQAAGRGKPDFNFRDGRAARIAYRGEQSLTEALRTGQTQPKSLASIDLDGNATPDLIVGYAYNGQGIVTVQHGNPDAYAPQDDAVFARMQQGYNPDSLLPTAETYLIPEPVDFLQAGDFNHDKRKDVLVAARGGGLFLLAGDGAGRLGDPQQIDLPGPVTALAAGEFRAADGFTDIAVGVSGSLSNVLLIFDGAAEGFSDALIQQPLGQSASGIEFGGLDDDPFMDVAVAAGSEILVVHGWGRKEQLETPASRVERFKVGAGLRGLAVGEFVWDRAGRSEIAALSDDGTIHVVGNRKLDARPFTAAEVAQRTRGKLKVNQASRDIDVESAPSWQPGKAAGWSEASKFASSLAGANSNSAKPLLRTNLSYRETDDLLVLSKRQSKLEIVRLLAPNEKAPNDKTLDSLAAVGDLRRTTLDLESAPLAVLTLPRKLNGVTDVVMLNSSSSDLILVPNAPNTTITVDRTDDPAGALLTAASACTAAGNDCSLRGAIQFANNPANNNTTISLPANTYILSINGTSATGCGASGDDNTVGDLGANQTMSIVGAGAATTIIRQTGTGPANDGDRIMCMNEVFSIGLVYSFSGVSFVGGREGTAAGTGSAIGGSGIIGGELNNSLTLTNVVFANNQDTVHGSGNLGGGGLQITGGDLIITNSTFGGTSGPGAYSDRSSTNTANAQAGSGGGITYTPSSPMHDGGMGTLTITGSTFSRNTAVSGIGGGGADLLIFAFAGDGGIGSGSASIGTSTFSNNQALSGFGGAILIESLPTTVATTSFTSNTASATGGAIYLGGGNLTLNGTTPSITFTGNTATNGGSGIGCNVGIDQEVGTGIRTINPTGGVQLIGTNTNLTGHDIFLAFGGAWTNNPGSSMTIGNLVQDSGGNSCGGCANLLMAAFKANNSTTTIAGNWTINGGTFIGDTGTVNVAGNFSFNQAAGGGAFTANSSTVNFNGTGSQSITNGTSITFFNLTDSNITQPLTLNNSLAVNSSLNVNGANAILAPVAGAVISGTGTLTGSGTARVSRIAATPDFLSQYTITNKTLTNLTIDYNGTSTQTVNNTPAYSKLRISGSGTKTLQGDTVITSNLDIISGATFASGNFNFALGGNWTNGGAFTPGTGTVTFQGSTGTQLLTGNTTFFNLTLNNSGATTSFGNTTTTIGNDLVTSAGTMDGSTSTIIFTGVTDNAGAISGAQPKDFFNLQINSPATISNTAGGNIVIENNYTNGGTFSQAAVQTTVFDLDNSSNGAHSLSGAGTTTFGNFTINAANTVDAGSHNFNVIGANFQSQGTFTGNTSTVAFNGGAAQAIIGNGAKNFAGLLINNANGVTVNNTTPTVDASVSGALTLTTDLLIAAGAILQQSGTSAGAGDAIGTVRRSDLGMTGRAFGNPFNTIAIDMGTAPTQMDVTLVKMSPMDFPAPAVARTYTLTPTGGSGISATVKLHYLDTELNSIPEAGLFLWRKDATVWNLQGRTGAVDTVNNAVTLSGVSQFSDWTLAGAPDLTISKTHSGNFTQAQTGATYTITVSNSGSANLAAGATVSVSDTLPTGLTATAISGTGWNCTQPAGPCTRMDALNTSSSYPALTLTVDVACNVAASVTNTASVSLSGASEGNPNNNTANDPTTVTQLPDLSISKTHSGNFAQGQVGATYTITVSNAVANLPAGPTVTVSDMLPAGLTATAISGMGWNCTLPAGPCTRTDGLTAGSSFPALALTVNVASNAAPSVTNTATVALTGATECNTANNTANDLTNITQLPDLTISKTHSGNFAQGQSGATYSITVSNNGSANLAAGATVSVSDMVPTGLTATAISGMGWNCTQPAGPCTRMDGLNTGNSYPALTLTVNVASNAAPSVTNQATVGLMGASESNTGNNSASDLTSVTQLPDLTIAKTHSGNFTQGQTGATYTITVSNNGSANLAAGATVSVSDTLPTGLTATAISGTGWNCTQPAGPCTRTDALNTGSSYPALTLTVDVACSAAASITNMAIVTLSGASESNTSNNSASDVTTVNQTFDLTISKTHVGTFAQGQTGAQYTITVNNSFANLASGPTVTVSDTLPTGMTATAISGTGWNCTQPAGPCTRTDGLNAGSSFPALTLTVNVASNAAASVTNSASVAVTGASECNTANNSANDSTSVTQLPDLTITKTHSGDFSQGQSGATYTITVSNNGSANLAAGATISVSDTVPTGLTATNIAGTGWNCTQPAGPCTRMDALNIGASYPALTLSVDVASNAAASVTNQATVSLSGASESNTGNNTASDPTTVNQFPNLAITKTHSGNFTQGQSGATYTITVSNTGSNLAAGPTVTVNETLPAGLTAVAINGAGWNCTQPAGPCTRADGLATGSSFPALTLTVNVACNATASVTNQATVSLSGATEGDTSNNTANDPTIVTQLPDLSISKTHSGNFAQAQSGAQYTITVSNAVANLLAGPTVTVSDVVPAGLTATGITGTGWNCAQPAGPCTRSDGLMAGSSFPALTLTVNVAANAAASVTNTASVSLTGASECNTANNSASDPTTVTQLPDLTISKSHSGNFSQGQTGATYTITVSNNGSANLAAGAMVSVSDVVPAGLTATGIAGAGWSCTQPAGPCTRMDALNTGSSYPALTLTVNVAANAAASVTNQASVTLSGAGESNTSNNSASDLTSVAQLPDLTITKSHSGNFTQAQMGATYTITVSNNGSANLAAGAMVSVSDTLPTGLTATGISGTGWNCTQPAGPCTRSDALNMGSSYPALTLTVNVACNATASLTNSASVSLSGASESDTSNNTANDPTTVTQLPDLSISKTHSGNFAQGQTGKTYTITVSNAVANLAAGPTVTVSDMVPAGLTATGINGMGWSCAQPAGPCMRTDGLIAGSSFPALTLTVNVAANAAASVTNTALVSLTGATECNTANNSASDPTTVTQLPDLTISKTGPTSATCGQTITYTLTANNVGSAAASNVQITDDLANCLSSVTVTSCPGGAGNCSVGAGNVVTANIATLAASASASVTITAQFNGSCNPSITNQATIATSTPETNAGNNSSLIITTTLTDTTKPVITCPANQVGVTNGVATTATVTVPNPTATDNCDASPTINCTRSDAQPFSNPVYPLGTTTVTCTASDHASPANTSLSCSFTVVVRTPRAAVNNLKTLVQALVPSTLSQAQANTLNGFLELAAAHLEQGNNSAACTDLANFVNQCNAFGPSPGSGPMNAAQRDSLLSYANKIRLAIGCSCASPSCLPAKKAGIFAAQGGEFYLKQQLTTGLPDQVERYGEVGDLPVAGDWDGDKIDSLGIYRQGVFHLRPARLADADGNPVGAEITVEFGLPGDLPVVGDWDGDGIDTIGVYRHGQFLLRNSNRSGPADIVINFGEAGDLPLAGDWDGDGQATVGVYNPTTGVFKLSNTLKNVLADVVVQWGGPGYLPVVGDWDGDGIATIGLYGVGGEFLLRNTNTAGTPDLVFTLGVRGGLPVAGRWGDSQ